MRKKLLLLLVLAVAGLSAVGGATLAMFADAAQSSPNVFRSGTLIIGAPGPGTNSGFMEFDYNAPGDSRAANLRVKNLGTLPFQYQVTANLQSGDQELYDHLKLAIQRGSDPLWSGWLSDLGGVLLNRNLEPDSPATPETEGIDELTFTVSLDLDVVNPDGSPYDDNLLQGKTVSIDFVFDATQTDGAYSPQYIPPQWVSGGSPQYWHEDEYPFLYNLPWDFPFYETHAGQVLVSPNGILTFDGSWGDWDNSADNLRTMRAIAPLWDDWTTENEPDDVFVKVEATTDRVTFTWVADNYDTGEANQFQATLHHDGRIQFNYGVAASVSATVGVSNGDGVRYFAREVTASDPSRSIVFNP